MPPVERKLLSEAGDQHLFARPGATTEAGPLADWQVPDGWIYKADIRSAQLERFDVPRPY